MEKEKKEGYENGKETTFYTIRVDVNGTEKTIKKRFNKFAELQEKLSKTYDRLPELPAKTLIKLTKAIDLDKRRGALEKYLKELVQRKDVYSDKSVLEFLEIDAIIPESVVASPRMVGTHSETRAICSFSYFPHLKSLYLSVSNRSTFIQKSGFFSFGKKKEALVW